MDNNGGARDSRAGRVGHMAFKLLNTLRDSRPGQDEETHHDSEENAYITDSATPSLIFHSDYKLMSPWASPVLDGWDAGRTSGQS